jgi:pyruvate,water dikinase
MAYPLLRQMLRELGRRLVSAGAIEAPDEVFWLTADEAASAAARLDRGEALIDHTAAIRARKAAWRAAQRATPPRMLPVRVFPGLRLPWPSRARGAAETLRGAAASPGRATAVARVIHGPEQFGHMHAGEVLVAPITTPAWTPLFAMASAIVTDIGGPLSHGSIVAREYGIPAVLGTATATRRIHSGDLVTVTEAGGAVHLERSDTLRPRPRA